uniref:Cell division protein n=1 Tax=Siphoviridae sp. ctvok7 TaxID=2827596 RepID=A0A8S5LLS3_9CAUD|nr:MAG TPA: cell division protein [Siphoviridae sp. ctvok7]
MDIEKLIEDLRGLLKQYGEKIPYGELVGAPWPYSRAGDLAWQDPEPYFIEQAASTLSTLQAENERLRKELEYEREHANAYHEECGQWEAENEKLRAELEQMKAERDAARSDIETALAYGMKDCELCKNSQCYVRGGTKPCLPKWRGQKEV